MSPVICAWIARAAEWEPALGVLVSWPPYLPRELFVEFRYAYH